MKPSPAFQFYPADFLVGCAELSAEQVGAYIRLLCYQWSKGALPDNNKLLAALAGCKLASVSIIRAKFTKGEDGLLRNQRLEEVRNEQEDYRKKQAERATRQWLAKGSAVASHRPASGSAMPSAADGSAVGRLCSSPSSSPSEYNLAPADAAAGEKPSSEAAKPKKARERNAVLDALATCDGGEAGQVTEPAWRAAATALKAIQEVSPDVTSEEVGRRARNYRAIFRDATISPNALAKHWARCDRTPGNPAPAPAPPVPEPFQWKAFLNHTYPDSVYSAGGTSEAHRWEDIPREYQLKFAHEIRQSA